MAPKFGPYTGNKFGAQKVLVDGVTFDSKGEAKRWAELVLLERAGSIRDLERQVRIPLVIGMRPILVRSKGYPNGRQAKYVADFAYTESATGEEVLEDFKGFDTPESRLKRAIVEAMTGFPVKITGAR